MLVFLFIFYLHYYLFNCDETEINAKFNESLIIDKHNQNLLQINAFLKNVQKPIHEIAVLIEDFKNETIRDQEFVYDNVTNWQRNKALGINQTHQNLKAHKFHPSPRYDPIVRHQRLFHWIPPGNTGFKVPLPPLVIFRSSTPNLMTFFPLQNSGQRPGPMHSMFATLPPRVLYQNIYLRPPGPYLPSPSYTPGPTRPKRLPPIYVQKNPFLINPLHLTISPPIPDPAVSSKTLTISNNAKIWLHEIAPFTPGNEKVNPSKDQRSPHYSGKTTVLIANGMSKTNDYWSSTRTANTGQLFNENVTLSEKDVKSDQIPNDPTKNGLTTMAGDVLPGNITVQKPSSLSPKQRYLNLMKLLDEGYMVVFMTELCRMIAVKDRREVQDVLYHTEMIYNSLWDNGRLAWIGDPLETVLWKLSGRDIDHVRTDASMMFHTLLERNQTLSAEVNSIIDEADLFYNDDEGDRLLYSLKQFEDYPNTTLNSYWLCENLIESFLLPFRRISRRRQRLIESINKALKERFPLLLKEHHGGTLADKASPKNGSQPKKRKRKHHHLPHKKKRNRKRHHTPEYNIRNINGKETSQVTVYMNLSLRTETPVTSDQPRFRATARKSYRKIRRSTTTYFSLLG